MKKHWSLVSRSSCSNGDDSRKEAVVVCDDWLEEERKIPVPENWDDGYESDTSFAESARL